MKKYAIGILAVVFAFAGAAFTAKKTTRTFPKTSESQFYYSYNLNTVAGENTASNYTYIVPQPTSPNDVPDCGGTDIPCVIHALGTTSAPDASQVNPSNLMGVTLTQKVAQR